MPVSPIELKKTAISFEETDWGRLFDADVHFMENNLPETLHREVLRIPDRLCFLCEQNAKLCAGRSRHPQELLLARVEEIAAKAFDL